MMSMWDVALSAEEMTEILEGTKCARDSGAGEADLYMPGGEYIEDFNEDMKEIICKC